MKVSYVSDLHTEFGDFYDFSKESGGDVLIIAGDFTVAAGIESHKNDPQSRSIKKYISTKFKSLCNKYAYVYSVMGNHEHYHSNFSYTKESLEKSYRELDVTIRIFDNHYDILDGWIFVGSSLWTNFEYKNPIMMRHAQMGMNDYRFIGADEGDQFNYKYSSKITPEFTYNEHIKSLQYIRDIIKGKEKVVVFTHMCPSFYSINPDHSGGLLDSAYASDLSGFILDNPQIKYWIHGHTHHNFDYKIGETNILANQRGYYGESSHTKFNGLSHIEI